MIVNVLRNWLFIGFINMIIEFYFAFRVKFEDYIILLGETITNKHKYTFVGTTK